jgi:thiol-disulfide isomerase/thioredoxin
LLPVLEHHVPKQEIGRSTRCVLLALACAGHGLVHLSVSAQTASPATAPTSHAAVPVLNLDGRPENPLADAKAKAVVLIFVCVDCPVANRYAPVIERLYQSYRSKNVNLRLVYADRTEDASKIRTHLREYGYHVPAVRDPEHRLVKLAHATKTPEAAVFAAGRKLVYHGRIDDRYTDYGKSRNAPSHEDLREAIDAVIQGKPVPIAVTPVVGCFIPELDP